MVERLRPGDFVPAGFVVEGAKITEGLSLLTVRSAAARAECPSCGTWSSRVQSRYCRTASDLPLSGRAVSLAISVRRFRCDDARCDRRIFAERFGKDILAPYARRTGRLETIVHHLGLALGGRPGAGFARRLQVPVSNDTLIRVVRRRATVMAKASGPPRLVGIDDFAFRRNCRYGTIVVDLERRRILKLLPDREPATVIAWLKAHTSIEVVARDRGGGYGEAVARALPAVRQVADRWHLMENASRAFLDAVRGALHRIRSVMGATTLNPALLSSAERLQVDGWARRRRTNNTVIAMRDDGWSIKEIARTAGLARGTVRRIVRGQRDDVFRSRQSSLEAHLSWLDGRWDAGHRNGAALWRELQSQGFTGSLRVVTEWATRRRKAECSDRMALTRTPSAQALAKLMTTGRDHLTKSETITVAAIENGVPELVDARSVIETFQEAIRRKVGSDFLAAWIETAESGLVSSFGRGVRKDEAAVRAAMSSPWSNGQAEGQITKLKLVKRQMYGRGKIDLLEARLLGTP